MSGALDTKSTLNMNALLDIISGDKTAWNKALKMMKALDDVKSKTVMTTSKNYRHVMIHTTCEHCGFVSHRLIELGKKDSISYRNKETGQINIVKFQDCSTMINVHALTRSCNNCANFINNMDVEELKIRYWNLLNTNPADMKHPPVKPDNKTVWFDEDAIIQENEEVKELKEEVVDYAS